MRNKTYPVILAAIALVMTACAPRVHQPEVRLEDARLASLGIRGGVIDVRLSVHNPNRFAVQTRGLTYDLEVRDPDRDQWVSFTEGRVEESLRVDARDGIEITLPVEFTYRGLGEAMRALIDRGSFDYRLSGVVELQAPVRRDIRYQTAGRYAPAGDD